MPNQQPPDHLMPILLSIESVTNTIAEEFPRLSDKEVEWSYEKLKIYYSNVAKGKTVEEPLTNLDRKQALVDEILNILELREEEGLNDELVNNPEIAPGGISYPNSATIYVSAFNYLRRSVRFWRKEYGPQGYIRYIRQFLSPNNQ